MTHSDAEIREQVLTEFKNVHRLAPADYTENCTNVVMSLVEDYVEEQTRLARLDENKWLRSRYTAFSWGHYDPFTTIDNRVAELEGVGNLPPKTSSLSNKEVINE